jgi:cell division protein ZapA
MSEAAVQLKVAGQTYQVVSSARESDLKRLAKVVEEALEGVTAPGRQPSPQALVLAAITLAHELEVAREETRELKEKYQRTLGSLLGRVDRVLAETESLANDEVGLEVAVEVKTVPIKHNPFQGPRDPGR